MSSTACVISAQVRRLAKHFRSRPLGSTALEFGCCQWGCVPATEHCITYHSCPSSHAGKWSCLIKQDAPFEGAVRAPWALP